MLPAINMLVTSAAGQEERGLVTSLYGAVRFIGVAVGPPHVCAGAGGRKHVMLVSRGPRCRPHCRARRGFWSNPDKELVPASDDESGGEDGQRAEQKDGSSEKGARRLAGT